MNMTDNQQKLASVIAFIAVPLVIVHVFPNSYAPRLIAVLWIYTFFPIIILLLAFFTKQTIKLKNYSNPIVEERMSLIVRGIAAIVSLLLLSYLAFPTWVGTYYLYIGNQPMVVIEDSVSEIGSTILSPGIYFRLTLHDKPNEVTAHPPPLDGALLDNGSAHVDTSLTD